MSRDAKNPNENRNIANKVNFYFLLKVKLQEILFSIFQKIDIISNYSKKNNVNKNINKPSNLCELNNSSTDLSSIIKSKKFNKLINYKNNIESISYAAEYLEEIFFNLLIDEKNIKIKPKYGYMKFQNSINEQMRAILIDWIVEIHLKLNLKIETLYQTIWIIDSFLSIKLIEKSKFQLLGISALLISCKINEIYYPSITNFIKLTDNTYKKEELIKMEDDVLQILEYNVLTPTSIQFYQIISKYFNFDDKVHYLGKFFLENSLIDYEMIFFSPSIIAFSCAYIVMKYFGLKNYKYLFEIYNFYNNESNQKIIKDVARKLCFLVKNLSKSNLKSIKEKYSNSKFFCVSKYCQ